jgi:hypothetical protein
MDKDELDIFELLDTVSVAAPDMWENDEGPKGWYAVVTDDGIVAYFAKETDALRYRLDRINRRMNP